MTDCYYVMSMKTGSSTISDKAFHDLIAQRAQTLLGLADFLASSDTPREKMIRPLLGELLSQSMQLEELLDTYDARNNCQWCPFRAITAAIKLFSDVGYELLHIQHALPAYRLLGIEHDFERATEQAICFTSDILVEASERMLAKARFLDLPLPNERAREKAYNEQLPTGRLPHNCGMRRTETISETVALLSTAFLNLAAESESVRSAGKAKPEDYQAYLSNTITEENIRTLQLRFHNLQSLYDTYVSGTEAEKMDSDLPVLRGHISVVFHLLKVATLYSHYFERHVNKKKCDSPLRHGPVVSPQALLHILMTYTIYFISQYIECAERLCRKMLKRYAEIGHIEVNVPPYRGFHVRPSTLIAKLVMHYGSEVTMELDGDKYDAGSSLDLFRANEKINAQKRRWLAHEIDRLRLVPVRIDHRDINEVIHTTILNLVDLNKVILYERPLKMPERPESQEGTVPEIVRDEIARLLALGKIDINTHLNVTFIGDKRVLEDIRLLAESGYGEDNLGNNILLPKELAYLRK